MPVAQSPGPATAEMLKVVTIMFADVVGSTSRAEQMHPEDTRALMTDFFQAMTEEIQRQGGTVERLMGDGIMADFGVPTAHEDDPIRAVKAAQAMLRRLEQWNKDKEPQHQIEIRVGINTGEVSTAGHPGQDLLVTGDPVNVAARLEQSAAPGTILIGSRTARIVGRAFQLQQLQPLTLKGKSDPVDCYVVGESREEGDQGWLEAPLVGRELQLATLLDVFDRCRVSGSPHLMTILGEAGVGKSRLVKEFIDRLASKAQILTGRCIAYGTGVTLWPLREILEGLCGIHEADPVETAVARVEGLVHATMSAAPEDASKIAAALASAIGLESPERLALDPRSRHREMLVAWRSFLSHLAVARPVVVVIEDIHWADDLMLDVLDDLACRTSGPLMFVCPTRSEVLKSRPTWGAGVANSMTIQLAPLSEQETSELIDWLLRSDTLPASIKQPVVARCEGNPFFVQEVLRQLIDQGAVHRVGTRWKAEEGSPSLDIPDHVQGVLLARLDLLSPEERAVAQQAAVIGRAFWQGALESLAGPLQTELPESLAELERRNFIAERTISSIVGEVEYVFTHALIKDVAYQTMLRRLRGLTHDAVARWIEQTSGDRVHELAELLAHHLDQAHELTPSEDIRSRARSFSLIASRKALQRFAIRQAEVFGRRAIDLSQPGPERVESLESFGDVCLVAYAIDDAWWGYKAAVAEALALSDASLVAGLAAKAAITATRYEGAMKTHPPPEDIRDVIDLGLDHAKDRDDRSRCLLLASLAFSPRVSEARPAPGIDAAPRYALELAEGLSDPELLSVALDAAAFNLAPEARYGEMYRLQKRRVGLVPQLQDVTEACDSLASACWASYLAGRYEESIRFAEECLKRADGVDPANYEQALQWRLIARFIRGDWDAALEDQALLESTIDDDENGCIPVFLGPAFSYTLLCHELRGDRVETEAYLSRIRKLKEEIGEDMGVPRAPTALTLLHQGHVEEAQSWLTLEASFSLGLILEAMCALAAEEGDLEAAAALSRMVRNDVKRMESPSLHGHVERLEGHLLEASGSAEEARLRLESSAATFAGLSAPWQEASSRLLLGEVRLRNGDEAQAERELQTSLDMFARLGSVAEVDRATRALERL